MLLNILQNIESYVSDPLMPETRSARKALLGFSFVNILIIVAGLVPEKIESMGLVFSKTDQHNILLILCLVIIYFLISFFFYGFADLIKLEVNIIKNLKGDFNEKFENAKKEEELKLKDYPLMANMELTMTKAIIEERLKNLGKAQKIIRLIVRIRIILEFILPITIGLVAIILTFSK